MSEDLLIYPADPEDIKAAGFRHYFPEENDQEIHYFLGSSANVAVVIPVPYEVIEQGDFGEFIFDLLDGSIENYERLAL